MLPNLEQQQAEGLTGFLKCDHEGGPGGGRGPQYGNPLTRRARRRLRLLSSSGAVMSVTTRSRPPSGSLPDHANGALRARYMRESSLPCRGHPDPFRPSGGPAGAREGTYCTTL
jgi:hypothetical protein